MSWLIDHKKDLRWLDSQNPQPSAAIRSIANSPEQNHRGSAPTEAPTFRNRSYPKRPATAGLRRGHSSVWPKAECVSVAEWLRPGSENRTLDWPRQTHRALYGATLRRSSELC